MKRLSRRRMLAASAAMATALTQSRSYGWEPANEDVTRKFTMDLSWGAIGVRTNQIQAIEYAAKYGFESVYADPGFLSSLDAAARVDLAATMQGRKIVWGAAGLPVDFRKDEATFRDGLKKLPATAKAMQLAGVSRVSTWLSPNHQDLTYMANFRQHARRLRECVKILGDHGHRFGMEYVGPKTLWADARHSFIHTLAETKDLIAEIDENNVGVVLDSWHWYTAHETVDDLRTLTNRDIIACDLNDAPLGLEIDDQIDNQRELPSATGVIDLRAFLGVLIELGYDGPVRAEPFNAKLNAMENDAACQATSESLKKSFSLLNAES
jgi:sugar phosphate isomerase/epimerase